MKSITKKEFEMLRKISDKLTAMSRTGKYENIFVESDTTVDDMLQSAIGSLESIVEHYLCQQEKQQQKKQQEQQQAQEKPVEAKPQINIEEMMDYEAYKKNEEYSQSPCIICGKDVSKIDKKMEQEWDKICAGEPKALKWYKNNFIHMSTDGNLYFADEDVADGEESQGCFAIGCCCMKKYKDLRKKKGF